MFNVDKSRMKDDKYNTQKVDQKLDSASSNIKKTEGKRIIQWFWSNFWWAEIDQQKYS